MDNLIKIEVLIATPPTSKCQETIAILEEIVRRYPEELSLVVFRRGIDFVPDELRVMDPNQSEESTLQQASIQMRTMIRKGSVVPVCVVDGVLFSAFEVPNVDELENKVKEVLARTKK